MSNKSNTIEQPNQKKKDKIVQQDFNNDSLKTVKQNLEINVKNNIEYSVLQGVNDIISGFESLFKILPNSVKNRIIFYLKLFFKIYCEQNELSFPADSQTRIEFILKAINKKQKELDSPTSFESLVSSKSFQKEQPKPEYKRIQKGELMCVFKVVSASSDTFENYIKNHYLALNISKPACQEIIVIRHWLRPRDLIKNTNSNSKPKSNGNFYYYVYMNFSPRVNLYLYPNFEIQDHENTDVYNIIKRPAYFAIFDKNSNIEAYYPEIYDNTKLSTTFDSLTLKNYLVKEEIESNHSAMRVVYNWNRT